MERKGIVLPVAGVGNPGRKKLLLGEGRWLGDFSAPCTGKKRAVRVGERRKKAVAAGNF
jgi:hypothetical protein